MTKLPVVSSDDVIRALKKAGFVYAPRRGKGRGPAENGLQSENCQPPRAQGADVDRVSTRSAEGLATQRFAAASHLSTGPLATSVATG
jgi:hypothetical protein